MFLEKDSAAEKGERNYIRKDDLTDGAKLAEFFDPEVSNAKNNQNNANLVEPVSSQYFFEGEDGLHALLSGLGRGSGGRAKDRRNGGGCPECGLLRRRGDTRGRWWSCRSWRRDNRS